MVKEVSFQKRPMRRRLDIEPDQHRESHDLNPILRRDHPPKDTIEGLSDPENRRKVQLRLHHRKSLGLGSLKKKETDEKRRTCVSAVPNLAISQQTASSTPGKCQRTPGPKQLWPTLR